MYVQVDDLTMLKQTTDTGIRYTAVIGDETYYYQVLEDNEESMQWAAEYFESIGNRRD